MKDLNIQQCPETGICSIIKDDGKKIDLIPAEVSQVRAAAGDPAAVRQVLAQVDADFAQGLDTGQIEQVRRILK